MEKSYVNSVFGLSGNSVNALKYSELFSYPGSYLLKETPMSSIPGAVGGMIGAGASEASNTAVLQEISKGK